MLQSQLPFLRREKVNFTFAMANYIVTDMKILQYNTHLTNAPFTFMCKSLDFLETGTAYRFLADCSLFRLCMILFIPPTRWIVPMNTTKKKHLLFTERNSIQNATIHNRIHQNKNGYKLWAVRRQFIHLVDILESKTNIGNWNLEYFLICLDTKLNTTYFWDGVDE